MTWIDIVLIVVILMFMAVGARLGSLWTGACVIGGFFGAVLADYYTLPVSELLGGFGGTVWIAWIILFSGGIIIILVPGYLLSRISSALFLGIIDSAVGFMTGALTGVVAVGLILILAVPIFPSVEKSAGWKDSLVVKPFHAILEDVFNARDLRRQFLHSKLKKDLKRKIRKELAPIAKSTKKKLKKTIDEVSEDLIDTIGN